MAFVLITLTASLILNLAVLALLKIGLKDDVRSGGSAGDFSGRLPC
ncbi:hypothetical protein ACFPN2_16595 [Steroidobacter flavus]|uniref:Uncharacterized protein n=1 Tax=Steroidobacter flavus TaxID=1842136 RepID=A0ABV8SSW2_9GAMM